MGFDFSKLKKLKKHELYDEIEEKEKNKSSTSTNKTNTKITQNISLPTASQNSNIPSYRNTGSNILSLPTASKLVDSSETKNQKYYDYSNAVKVTDEMKSDDLKESIPANIAYILERVRQTPKNHAKKILQQLQASVADANQKALDNKLFSGLYTEEGKEKLEKTNEKLIEQIKEENATQNATQLLSNDISPIVKTLADTSENATNALITVGLSAINPALGQADMYMSSSGSAIAEALENGKGIREAKISGDIKGAIEVGTGLLTGGIKFLPKGTLDDVATSFISSNIKSKVGQRIASKGYEIGGEVLEEVLTDIGNNVVDKFMYQDDRKIVDFNQLGETSKITVLTTLALNALGLGGGTYNQVQNLNAQKNISNINNGQSIQNSPSNLQQNIPSVQNNSQGQQIIQEQNNIAQNQNMEELITNQNNIANNQETLYNTTESESGVNEDSGGIKQNDKRRVQELLEKFERGQGYGSSNSQELRSNQIQQDITEGTVKQEIINYAKKYEKNNLTEQELKLKNIINNLGGNVVFYELGIENIFPGLANTNEFYIDTIGNENINNIFYHELTHYLRQNNNPIYVSEIQPIVNEIASDYDYQEAIFNYASTSKEIFDIRKLNGTRQLELAEEVVADYNASFYGDMSVDYGLPDNMKNRIKSAMDKIISQNLNNNLETDTTQAPSMANNTAETSSEKSSWSKQQEEKGKRRKKLEG